MAEATDTIHPVATDHLPAFITAPGESDVLMNVVIVFVIVAILGIGNLYLRLHSLPERMAHRANIVQFEIVAILALIALLTHNNLFWIAALILAFIRFPDFSTPLASIAGSLETLSRNLSPIAARQASSPAEARVVAPPDPAETPHEPRVEQRQELAPVPGADAPAPEEKA